MKKWIFGVLASGVLITGASVYTIHAAYAGQTKKAVTSIVTPVTSEAQKKQDDIWEKAAYAKNHGQAINPSSVPLPKVNIVTTPNERLGKAETQPIPAPAVFTRKLNFTETTYNDEINWVVWAGSMTSDPSTGFLLIADIKMMGEDVKVRNPLNLEQFPNAGAITITGFKNHVVSLSSSKLGNGKLVLATGKVTWK